MIGRIASCLAGVFVSMFGWVSSLFQPAVPVETADEALVMAKEVIDKNLPDWDYTNYEFGVDFDEIKKEWIVSVGLKWPEYLFTLGGTGPVVHIKKSNGKITRYERPGK